MKEEKVVDTVGYNAGALLGSLMRRTGVSNFILGALDVSGLGAKGNNKELLYDIIEKMMPVIGSFLASKAVSTDGETDQAASAYPPRAPAYPPFPPTRPAGFDPAPPGIPDPPGHFKIDVQDTTKMVLPRIGTKRFQAFVMSHRGDIVSIDADDSLTDLFARLATKIEEHKESSPDDDPISSAA